jgi:redox-sensitive bicupin YhaK (pirin superfamily)
MSTLRSITQRLHCQAHGPIARLISPDAASGEALKPFVFLDHFDADIQPGFGFGMHPHSGIATLTWQPDTDVRYEDTTGQKGTLLAGGLEWMNAGGGAWHQGQLMGRGHAQGFQLWVAMPPGVENGPSQGQYVVPEAVASLRASGAQVLVLLGECTADGAVARSPIDTHQDMNYFVVVIEAGAQWRYSPPAHHDVAWAFGFDGQAQIQNEVGGQALLTMSAAGDIVLSAPHGPARVLMGTAQKHNHPLVLGPSSVHTSEQALIQGLQRIQTLGQTLVREGRLDR